MRKKKLFKRALAAVLTLTMALGVVSDDGVCGGCTRFFIRN